MDYVFTPAADKLKPSAIREILKLSTDPNVIPFSAGNPSPEAFPSDAVAEVTAAIFREHPISALQYSITEGFIKLRTYLKEYMSKKYSVGNDADDIIITCGAQQVMSLAATALAGPGDTIICEKPSFVGSINALKLSGATLKGIPMENDGMDINALEETIKTSKNVKLLYVIPNFQNPTGITTSLEKRKAIYAIAKKYGIIIIEDNPYGDLYFKEAPPASIKSMDTDGIVVYAGSASKVISPGLRVGWCIAPKELISKFTALKQTQDVHSNILAQMIVYDFMAKYDFEKHLDSLRTLYTKKASLCFEEMNRHLAPEIEFQLPGGGLFAWCKLPEKIGMTDFCSRAIKDYSVAVVPGIAFNISEDDTSRFFRINYSTPTDEQIKTGMEKLGQLKADMLK